ncbi:MAG: hypothetical protein JRN06_08315 [Nitrososphaerota archaeon]|nr:hypothetical protein [Nitrososphaerota archaeon]MDG7024213.1 hypothetical protein [Nitrososphaerota archaeon]
MEAVEEGAQFLPPGLVEVLDAEPPGAEKRQEPFMDAIVGGPLPCQIIP